MHMRKLQRQRREPNFPPCEFGSESLPLRHTQVPFDQSCKSAQAFRVGFGPGSGLKLKKIRA